MSYCFQSFASATHGFSCFLKAPVCKSGLFLQTGKNNKNSRRNWLCFFCVPCTCLFLCLEDPFSHSLSSCAKLLSCVRLCDPVDCSLPGSSAHGILQARVLEWVAMPFLLLDDNYSAGPSLNK